MFYINGEDGSRETTILPLPVTDCCCQSWWSRYAFPLFRSMGSFGTDAEKPLARPGIQVSLSHFAGIFSLLLQELADFLVGIIGIRQRIGLHGCHQFLLFGDDFVKHRHIAFITLLCLLVTSFGTLDKETLAKIAELKKTDPKAAAELSRERS